MGNAQVLEVPKPVAQAMNTLDATQVYKRKIVDPVYVAASFERWVRWVFGLRDVRQVSMTGKLMQGVRDHVCPEWLNDIQQQRGHDPLCILCHGTGRINLEAKRSVTYKRCTLCDANGMFLGDYCWRCKGAKVISVQERQVNPACIRSTKNIGAMGYEDVVATKIHDLVFSWAEHDSLVFLHKVSIEEYLYIGKQEDKCRRLRLSRSFYQKNLHEARYRVERMLIENRV